MLSSGLLGTKVGSTYNKKTTILEEPFSKFYDDKPKESESKSAEKVDRKAEENKEEEEELRLEAEAVKQSTCCIIL